MASEYVVASICGCWYRESGVNPGIWESLIPCDWDYQYEYTAKGGYGLGQWTNVGTSHGRLYNLHTWVTSNGYVDGEGAGQVAFMKHEGYWSNSSQTRGSYTSLDEFLKTDSTDIGELVWDFLANWEGVAGNAYDIRLEHARSYLTYINEHKNDSPLDFSWTSKKGYLSEAQTLANVMCVYFLLKDDTPTPPQPKYKKLSIFLMTRNVRRY